MPNPATNVNHECDPSRQITLLFAAHKVGKKIIWSDADKQWKKGEHPHAKTWAVRVVGFDSLRELFRALTLASKNMRTILIHGAPREETNLTSTPRRGALFREGPRRCIVIDLDDFEAPTPDPTECAKLARTKLPEAFHNAACIFQATRSHWLTPGKARLRLFFLTNRPVMLRETRVILSNAELNFDHSIYHTVQPVFLGIDCDGGYTNKRDPVPDRWGVLPGEAHVMLSDTIEAAPGNEAERRGKKAPAGVIPNEPHMIARALDKLAVRDAARIANAGRRNTFRHAAEDFHDCAVAEDVTIAAIVQWFFPSDENEAALENSLFDHGVKQAVAIVRRVNAIAAALPDEARSGAEILGEEDIENQIAQAYSGAQNEFGASFISPERAKLLDRQRVDRVCGVAGTEFGLPTAGDNDNGDDPSDGEPKPTNSKTDEATKAIAMLDPVNHDANIRRILSAFGDRIPLFTRGFNLVAVGTTKLRTRAKLPNDTREGDAPETSAFISVTQDWLEAQMTKFVDCRRMTIESDKDGKRQVEKQVSPPSKEARYLIASPQSWGVKPIHQIADAPYVTPDGEIVSAPGYDARSGTFLTRAVALPDVSGAPTWFDAIDALGALDSLLDEFPFVDDASRSAALSLVLTLITRNLTDVVPLHAISAPTAGTGKSELAAIATRVALGRELPAQAVGRTEDETQKRVEGAIYDGHPVLALDNVNGVLKGDALAIAVTQESPTLRVLGRTGQVTVSNRTSIIVTGNNVRLAEDMTRRSLLISLDAGVERPEQRQFRRTSAALKAHIGANRGKLIAAVLTVVRAYIFALRRRETTLLPPVAGFDLWSAYVRSPIVWLGRADPLDTQSRVIADDPEGQRRAAIFNAWHALSRGEEAKTRDVFVTTSEFTGADDEREAALAALREGVPLPPGRQGDEARARALGNYFASAKGAIAGGLRLEGKKDRKGFVWWRTVPTTQV